VEQEKSNTASDTTGQKQLAPSPWELPIQLRPVPRLRLLRSPSIAATPCMNCQRPFCERAIDNHDARNRQSVRPPEGMRPTAPLLEAGWRPTNSIPPRAIRLLRGTSDQAPSSGDAVRSPAFRHAAAQPRRHGSPHRMRHPVRYHAMQAKRATSATYQGA